MESTKDTLAGAIEQKRAQRAKIGAYIELVHTTTGLSREQIELDLLADAVKRAQDKYNESAEYPESADGIKGGQGHSAEELRSGAEIGVSVFVCFILLFIITVAFWLAHKIGGIA